MEIACWYHIKLYIKWKKLSKQGVIEDWGYPNCLMNKELLINKEIWANSETKKQLHCKSYLVVKITLSTHVDIVDQVLSHINSPCFIYCIVHLFIFLVDQKLASTLCMQQVSLRVDFYAHPLFSLFNLSKCKTEIQPNRDLQPNTTKAPEVTLTTQVKS